MLLLVNQLASNQIAPAARVCGLCTSVDHFTDSCPALQQQAASPSSSTPVDTPQAYAANIFNNNRPQQQNHHDLSTNRYNPGWRNHPNLRWGNQGTSSPNNFKMCNHLHNKELHLHHKLLLFHLYPHQLLLQHLHLHLLLLLHWRS